jgi:hypothetical protein
VKKEFRWANPRHRKESQDVAKDILSSQKVDRHVCVITDLDYFIEMGYSKKKMKEFNLIVDFAALEKAAVGNYPTEASHCYNPDKITAMIGNVFVQWRKNALNNEDLEREIDKKVFDEILALSESPDQLVSPKIKNHITVEMCRHIKLRIEDIVEKYIEKDYNDNYDFNGLDEYLIQRLLDAYTQNNWDGNKKLFQMMETGSKIAFLERFKNKNALSSVQISDIETGIIGDWITDIKRDCYESSVASSVSSLDYYCAELARNEVGKRSVVNNERYIRSAFIKIIEEWRSNSLPTNDILLKEHFERFCRQYFEGRMKGSDIEAQINRDLLTEIVLKRKRVVLDLLKELCHLRVSELVEQEMSLPSRKLDLLSLIVKSMIESYKHGLVCDYHNEISIITRSMKDKLVNSSGLQDIRSESQAFIVEENDSLSSVSGHLFFNRNLKKVDSTDSERLLETLSDINFSEK